MIVGAAASLGCAGFAGAMLASFPPPGEIVYVASTPEPSTSQQWLVTARTDGTNQVKVFSETMAGFAPWGPRWSPDGDQIAFTRAGSYIGDGRVMVQTSSVFVVGANGEGLRAVSDGYAELPRWSPDGRWLAYQDDGDEYGIWGCCRFYLRIVRPDGSGGKKVAFGGTDSDLYDWVFEGTDWAWSRDSRQLAYVYPARSLGVEPGGLRPLAVGIVDIETMKKRYLAPGTHPAWSPDGSQLVLGMGDEPASFASSHNPGRRGAAASG